MYVNNLPKVVCYLRLKTERLRSVVKVVMCSRGGGLSL